MFRTTALSALALVAVLSGVQSFAPHAKVTNSHQVGSSTNKRFVDPFVATSSSTQLNLQLFKPKEETVVEPVATANGGDLMGEYETKDFALSDEKKLEVSTVLHCLLAVRFS